MSPGAPECAPSSHSPSTGCSRGLIGGIRRPAVYATALFLGVAVSCLALYQSAYSFQFLPSLSGFSASSPVDFEMDMDLDLEQVLKKAAMADGTVILTTVNKAWAEAGSLMDMFLESFRIGNNTERLLKHLVIISLDQKAHNRCSAIHPHCYVLKTETNSTSEAYFMTPIYLEMMWRRIRLLGSVLLMGYSFVFTDADVMWLRDPFPHFYADADFQISCDSYLGNPYSRKNEPNGGFNYAKSNNRTVAFYKYWYFSRKIYPGRHDQTVLNKIKNHRFLNRIGLQMRFLDTAYFGGFCEPSKDFNRVCTMHANCCYGLGNKVHDLNLVLQDWKNFTSLPPSARLSSPSHWRAPQRCSIYAYHPPETSN